MDGQKEERMEGRKGRKERQKEGIKGKREEERKRMKRVCERDKQIRKEKGKYVYIILFNQLILLEKKRL